ncbi:MAG: AAA family ATPase [Clostridiales bacterium GWB2_37_7]|nr:MAG: AAA family ATPase [Clostridiales bacterium GWB2_37_7]
MKAVEQVYQALLKLEQKMNKGVSANEISQAINTDRANVSRYLNRLFDEKRVERLEGRPVLFCSKKHNHQAMLVFDGESSLDKVAAIQSSLQAPIQQAKAAIIYPPKGLHTLLLGETGVGKSMFAELMYQFAKESLTVKENAPFIRFNCADYAENPQLLVSQIFGVKKGAYTGADRDREGLIGKADGGFLFLDEVHRLSPQGQEMLFTFIDKGIFRPLGETEESYSSEVRIIAATTEQPQSYLLNTFTRRIPMIIELPSLKNKDLTERYHLIELFIKQESKRIGKSINAEKNAVISFLLYDCPNNIGQLKSDIQLTCAKSFINYKAKNEDSILITSTDLPQHVRKGMLMIHEHRNDIEFLLKSKSPTIKFSDQHAENYDTITESKINEDFYDIIEHKLETLKSSGMKSEEISYAINMGIEAHFKKYLGDIPVVMQSKDLRNIVDQEILTVAEKVLKFAEQSLGRVYEEKIHIGLALHLHGFVERIKKGVKIYHPKLNMIRVEYPQEFMAAMEAAKILDSSFDIHTPLDEIGYIALFLFSKPYEVYKQEKSIVGVLVMMHGNSTADSMVQLCNAMIGVNHAVALDMPLDMNPMIMYEYAKEKVRQMDMGRGVMLLVDMGSLTSFGQMLQEETGIIVKTIDMTSTAVVIDVCRKAVLGRDIHYIYDSIKPAKAYHYAENTQENSYKNNIIITACFTGEGASERLKCIIEESLKTEAIKIIPLNIMNKKEFLAKIEQCREGNKILAIVSTIDIDMEGVPFVSAAEILTGNGLCRIREIIDIEKNYLKIANSLKSHIRIDSEALVECLRDTLAAFESRLGLYIKEEVKIGILLHMCFLLDKLKSGGKEILFEGLQDFRELYTKELAIVRGCIKSIESKYKVQIGEHEEAYICKMLLSNGDMLQEIVKNNKTV